MYKMTTPEEDFRFLNWDQPEDHLIYHENYGVYDELVVTGFMKIDTRVLSTLDVMDRHLLWITNIFRDGIENPKLSKILIEVHFVDGETVYLSIFDYYINIIFWRLAVNTQTPITSFYLFFEENFTKGTIKKYIDTKLLDIHRRDFDNNTLNRIIDDCMYKFVTIDEFAMFFLNTINNEDTIAMMAQDPEFNAYLHSDFSNVPLEEVKDRGMDITMKIVNKIKNQDWHCLSGAFQCGEGINIKQYREFVTNIGTKPDGNGNIFDAPINSSYSMGMNEPYEFHVDGATGRQSEIIKKKNVGESGRESRLVGLNNSDTQMVDDPNYICNTRNLIQVTITNKKILDMYKNRWYRTHPNGVEFKMSSMPLKNEMYLLGKTLWFRSPMTCASHSRGEGICYRCYGDLAYVNRDINVGKIAAEIIWSQLTQMLLSAKHLLESSVIAMNWPDKFHEMFDIIDGNTVSLKSDINVNNCYMMIGPIESDDDDRFSDYVMSFTVQTPDGTFLMSPNNDSNMYLLEDFSKLLESYQEDDEGVITIPFRDIVGMDLLNINIMNNEISHALKSVNNIIDKSTELTNLNKDQWIQELLERVVEGKLNVDAVHCEVILSNQIRAADDVLKRVQWEYPNQDYMLLTLKQALARNPNICITLENERIQRALYAPLSFKKTAPSQYDLFFMEQPQNYMSAEAIDENAEADTEDKRIPMIIPLSKAEKLKK